MAMAASLLAAPSLRPPASWRRRPLLAAPAPANRLWAPVSPPPRTPQLVRVSRAARVPIARAARGVALSQGGGDKATEWGPLATRLALGAVLGSAALLGCGAALAAAEAVAEDSIRASRFGLRVAASLRRLGWPDDAVVFTLATLPVLELRGAIPAGYWMRLHPVRLTFLSVLGNMVPVPFIILYLKKLATFLSQRSASATRIMDLLFERARQKAAPVEEFQWLGLMLFVAVPFPGTGAWTGAIIASVLGMPFWSGLSANFAGVVLAGLLVNLLMNLGLKYAIVTGVLLFFVSTIMWGVLRSLKKSLTTK
uniref:Uncharacterized protein n=1 Tax=Avena sativa TaxID=4498 RepID=A0ACD6A8Y8_AVESA